MIQDYLDFNIAKFVRDCYEHKKLLPSLKEQLDDLLSIKGIDPAKDKVQTSGNDDGLVNIVMMRSRLQERISDYEKDLRTLENALQALTQDEREAIDICFNGKDIQRQIEDAYISRRTLYDRRRRALDKLSKAIVG